jgi:hypothetical protein
MLSSAGGAALKTLRQIAMKMRPVTLMPKS